MTHGLAEDGCGFDGVGEISPWLGVGCYLTPEDLTNAEKVGFQTSADELYGTDLESSLGEAGEFVDADFGQGGGVARREGGLHVVKHAEQIIVRVDEVRLIANAEAIEVLETELSRGASIQVLFHFSLRSRRGGIDTHLNFKRSESSTARIPA